MEVLLEQGIPSSSFLPTTPPLTHLPAIPPIQHDPLLPLTQQTWQGTSYNLSWEQQAWEGPQPMSNLPAIVLGLSEPQPCHPALCSSLMSSGITSMFPTLPSFPDDPIPIARMPLIPTSLLSYTGMSPYQSLSNLPPHQTPQGSPHQSSSPHSL